MTPPTNDCFADTVEAWNTLRFNPSEVSSWSPSQARTGLVALERLTRSITATKTALVGQLAANRDTTATIVRETGMSRRSARELRAAAKVISEHPEALGKLLSGELSTEHLSHVSQVAPELAGELLDVATTMSADDYKSTAIVAPSSSLPNRMAASAQPSFCRPSKAPSSRPSSKSYATKRGKQNIRSEQKHWAATTMNHMNGG
jgi:hypothetical protein